MTQVETYYSAHAVDQYGVARCWGRGETAPAAEAQCLEAMREYTRPDLRLTLRGAQPARSAGGSPVVRFDGDGFGLADWLEAHDVRQPLGDDL